MEALIEAVKEQRRREILDKAVPSGSLDFQSDVPRVLVDGRMQSNNLGRALDRALVASMSPAMAQKLPSIFSSRQRNAYCACGKRDDAGRRLKFGECCGKGR